MNFLTFTGETPAQALKKAQNECGEDAYVISTKQVKKKSLNSPGLYEVIVALEESMPKPKEIKREDSEDVLLNISEAAKQISKIANVSTDKKLKESKELPLTESFSTKELGTIKQEINKLADKIKLIQEMFWDEKAPQRDNLAIPSEFAQIYKLAMQSGMSKEHLNTIMRLTLEHMPTRMKSSSETVKRYFQVLLRKMIPVRHESTLNKGQQKVMMFVGPTGVGKTTTLAKLAARYSYLAQQRYKVGIITLDTYRIGAVEQLFQYAKMMRLPVEDVVDINDFENAIKSLAYCDIILVDTVGSSQYDKEKLLKLDTFLKDSSAQIDVNLVLSAGTKLEDLKEIYSNYSFLNIDTLIFTKLDETKVFGNIFSLIYETKKPISYFSTGQEVPDDLRISSSEFLVECILDGFKKDSYEKSSQ
ncbi:MAG: flagellar biosynthesis protein FlhF [Sulfurospirillaceae bacterium]|nr:flagellar biosynthesis protein FlhF [Sulfurospirillaceae bacterium]MCK9545512.1 flagellar biosynthesis protein FlhF [Sulfurospirillaceae bacterium]